MSSRPAAIFITGRNPDRHFDDSHSGYTRIHAYAACEAGYDTHVICLERGPFSERSPYAVHAVLDEQRTPRQMYIPFRSSTLAKAVLRVVEGLGYPPTIIHGVGLWGHPAVRARDILTRRSVRSVALVGSYTTYLDESLSQWRSLESSTKLVTKMRYAAEQAWIRAVIVRYEREAYRAADRVLVNYRSVERLIHSRFGADIRCQLVPYTILSEFTSGVASPIAKQVAKVKRSRPVIVCIARQQPRKGVDILLRSLRLLKDRGHDFHANVIGPGELLDQNRRRAGDLALSDCVSMLGLVPNAEDYLRQADIFVLPSREEQSGSLALLEAMRAGLACVATACDGIPEDVTHLSDAWLAKPGDHVSLAEGIAALIGNTALRERLARAAQKTFQARFSRSQFSAVLTGVYADALDLSGSATV